jgi:hypothetical protein
MSDANEQARKIISDAILKGRIAYPNAAPPAQRHPYISSDESDYLADAILHNLSWAGFELVRKAPAEVPSAQSAV